MHLSGSSGCSARAGAPANTKSPLQNVCLRLRQHTHARPQRQQRHCPSAGVAAADRTQSVSSTDSGGASSSGRTEANRHHDNNFISWLTERGVQQDKVTIQPVEKDGGYIIDTTVAATDLAEGEVIMRVPEDLVVTLNSVFEDSAVADLLTTGKLSELACLTLYMMYEKKEGESSRWYYFIKELDRQRARGQQGAKSPLLWEPGEVEKFLAGSPVQNDIRQRLKGIEREYEELDTVWFMAGSLFKNYPYDTPTDAFPLKLFRQAFAAVQASVVHLQGVPLSQRFALVPLGPPLLGYSPTAKALLKYDTERKEVALTADRAYAAGDPILAWCGPQPNSRLLVNYGVVEDNNPFDKLQLTCTIPNSDPLFKAKRDALQPVGLATQQTFDLKAQGLPASLVSYLRLAHAQTAEEVSSPGLADAERSAPLNSANESEALHHLAHYLQSRLDRYQSTVEEDERVIADSTNKPRQRVAARLLRIEKGILHRAIEEVAELAGETPEELRQYSRLTSALHIVKLT